MATRVLRLLCAAFFLLSTLVSAGALQAAPGVVTSIRPYYLIAQDLMGDVGQPVLLMDSQADPHHFSLRLSDRRLLDEADVLVWTGPELEHPLASLAGQLDAELITVSELSEVVYRTGDSHVWLDPANALAIASVLARALQQADAENAEVYQRNLSAFRETLVALDDGQLQPAFDRPLPGYAVYHNAYAYFETHFGFAHVLSLTGNEALKPGVQQIRRFRAMIDDGSIQCLVLEPGIDRSEVNTLIGKAGLAVTTIDPLGHDVDAEEHRYATFLQGIADKFLSCPGGQAVE